MTGVPVRAVVLDVAEVEAGDSLSVGESLATVARAEPVSDGRSLLHLGGGEALVLGSERRVIVLRPVGRDGLPVQGARR